MAELICVDPAQVENIWPHAKHLIRAAVARADLCDFATLESDILSGRYLLWVVWGSARIEAAVATSLEIANGLKSCTIIACGGSDMGHWLHLSGQIEAYARGEGCHCIRIIGRKGWLRSLDGYRAKHVILEKAI